MPAAGGPVTVSRRRVLVGLGAGAAGVAAAVALPRLGDGGSDGARAGGSTEPLGSSASSPPAPGPTVEVLVADRTNCRIRSIGVDGAVTTVAGSGVGHVDGPAAAARFTFPFAVAVGPDGRTFVSDQGNHRIRVIDADGAVSTLAGGVAGFADGPGADARFDLPYGLVVAPDGTVYVADVFNHRIRAIDPDGVVRTLAGGEPGLADGPAASARFTEPSGLALAADGSLFVADRENNLIRRIDPGGTVATVAGSTKGLRDGSATEAQLSRPTGIALDAATGDLYVAETHNHAVRVVSADGEVRTLAGSGAAGSADGVGAEASFDEPCGVALDPSGLVYVADRLNDRIRTITPDGVVSTLAGAEHGMVDGELAAARFDQPYGLAVVPS